MSILSYFYPRRLYSSSSRFNHKIEVIESFGSIQLVVNGIVQTGIYTKKLFSKGLRALSLWHTGSMQNILVLGVGGGGVFVDLHAKYPNARITGIEIDPEIINLSKKYFGISKIPNISLICSSAQDFLNRTDGQRYDLVLVDIYIGNDVPEFATKTAFVHAVHRRLTEKGSVMINYFSAENQKEKSNKFKRVLSGIFSQVQSEENYRNIFFYCRN